MCKPVQQLPPVVRFLLCFSYLLNQYSGAIVIFSIFFILLVDFKLCVSIRSYKYNVNKFFSNYHGTVTVRLSLLSPAYNHVHYAIIINEFVTENDNEITCCRTLLSETGVKVHFYHIWPCRSCLPSIPLPLCPHTPSLQYYLFCKCNCWKVTWWLVGILPFCGCRHIKSSSIFVKGGHCHFVLLNVN